MARSKDLDKRLAGLSPEKRALLEKRLKGKTRAAGGKLAETVTTARDLAWLREVEVPADPPVDDALWSRLVEVGHREARARWSADDLAREYAFEEPLSRKAIAYIGQALRRIGVFREVGERYTLEELWRRAAVIDDHKRAMRRWMATLEDEGLMVREGDHYRNTRPLPPPEVDALLTDREREVYGTHLPALLRGAEHPLEYFIPDGSSERVEANYVRSPTFRYCNGVSAELLRVQVEALPPGRKLQVLEVGAGTGGTSVSFFPILPPERSLYAFTDVSKFFTDRGREKYAEYPFIHYAELNIENDPLAQGLPAHAFDWVVAAHVLHATRDLRETLRHVRELMVPGGVLLLLEETKFLKKFNFSMGFLPGFDRFQDKDLRDLHPLLDSKQWGALLNEEGFSEFASFTDPEALPQKLGVDVMLARLSPSASRVARHAWGRRVEPIRRRPDPKTAPLSFAQHRTWKFIRKHPGSSVIHNVCHLVRLEGDIDIAALHRALAEIVRRHEVLRTRFVEVDGKPVGIVDPPSVPDLPLVDFRTLQGVDTTAEEQRLLRQEGAVPFDLEVGPVIRFRILCLEPTLHVLMVLVHHIAIDGWSLAIVVREMVLLYEAFQKGQPSPLPELPVQYGDFALWQEERVSSEQMRKEIAFWQEELRGCPQEMAMPFRKERPEERLYRPGGYGEVLPPELAEGVKALARREGATLFIVALAAFAAVLRKATGEEDMVLGTPTAGRPHEMLEGLAGYFLNLLPLRVRLAGDPTFEELLRSVRETTLRAFSHQEVPFEELVCELGIPDDTHHPPLVQVMITVPTLGSGEGEAEKRAGLSIQPFLTLDVGSEYDLTFYVVEARDGLRVNFGYDLELIDAALVVEMTQAFASLLREAVRDPTRRLSEYSF